MGRRIRIIGFLLIVMVGLSLLMAKDSFAPTIQDSDGDGLSDDYEISSGTDPYDASSGTVPMSVSVLNVYQPEGGTQTYLEVMINSGFVGVLPNGITSIVVKDPNNNAIASYPSPSFTYMPAFRNFFVALGGSPIPGNYTFEVTSGLLPTTTAVDVQKDILSVSVPDASAFSPSDGALLFTTGPTFSWGAVSAGFSPVYYRLEINDLSGNRVYASNHVAGMLSHTVQSNRLRPGQSYRYRVRACDHEDYFVADNRANSRWVYFTVESGPLSRLDFLEVRVFNGTLDTAFDVHPGVRDQLISAVLSTPNRGLYTYNLTDDKGGWTTECRFRPFWNHNFGPAGASDFGTYTLTLNFADGTEEVHARSLEQVTVGAPSDINPMVNADGSATVTWTRPASGQYYYQVRVRDAANEEYHVTGMMFDVNQAYLTASNLACLEKGKEYRWLVRLYDKASDYDAVTSQEAEATYSPASLVPSPTMLFLQKFYGSLAVGFDVRPGSRAHLRGARVSGPSGFNYIFNLTSDWFDQSTETRFLRGWWHSDPAWHIAPGPYTFTLEFDEDNNGTLETYTYEKVLSLADVTPVNPSAMGMLIRNSGTISFSWALPAGVSGQRYYVRVRSADETGPGGVNLEYYSSPTLTDGTTVSASGYELRGLEEGRSYYWFVRATDPGAN